MGSGGIAPSFLTSATDGSGAYKQLTKKLINKPINQLRSRIKEAHRVVRR
jgi:hypothetical protein